MSSYSVGRGRIVVVLLQNVDLKYLLILSQLKLKVSELT
jgi:hypothetical protein